MVRYGNGMVCGLHTIMVLLWNVVWQVSQSLMAVAGEGIGWVLMTKMHLVARLSVFEYFWWFAWRGFVFVSLVYWFFWGSCIRIQNLLLLFSCWGMTVTQYHRLTNNPDKAHAHGALQDHYRWKSPDNQMTDTPDIYISVYRRYVRLFKPLKGGHVEFVYIYSWLFDHSLAYMMIPEKRDTSSVSSLPPVCIVLSHPLDLVHQ